MWDLIVSVPDHCLSFYFSSRQIQYDANNKETDNKETCFIYFGGNVP